MPTIEVETNRPRVLVNGLPIVTAPTVAEFYVVLDKPWRVDSGPTPAPHGHRKNQIHVYDELGVRFVEHHYTGRVEDISCSFDTDEPLYPFTPHFPFKGDLIFQGVKMPLGGPERRFFETCPLRFVFELCTWAWQLDDFHISIQPRGRKLRSVKRSKTRRIVDVSVSWPHDNWAEPAGG